MATPGHALLVSSRIELPTGGQAYWPAFWAIAAPALAQPQLEPGAGEVDIVETKDDAPWVGQFLHCGSCKANWDVTHELSLPSGSVGWHVYSWMWVNEKPDPYIALYIDQKLQLEVSEHSVGKRYWEEAFDHPYYLVYDLAVGGPWAGSPNNSTAPSSSMKVDYLEVQSS
jgi:beta-glucanase (GH16 family)